MALKAKRPIRILLQSPFVFLLPDPFDARSVYSLMPFLCTALPFDPFRLEIHPPSCALLDHPGLVEWDKHRKGRLRLALHRTRKEVSEAQSTAFYRSFVPPGPLLPITVLLPPCDVSYPSLSLCLALRPSLSCYSYVSPGKGRMRTFFVSPFIVFLEPDSFCGSLANRRCGRS